jgi:membrane-bound metal-dependent hydrolase YbcI (DUF457 family)
MALSLAHSAAGYLVYEAVRPADRHRPALLAAAVLLANGPDLDFLPGLLLGHPGAYHRGQSHTILAVAAVAVAAALAARWLGRPPRRALGSGLWAAAAYGSHLLLDFVTPDAVPPHGAPFLWPLSSAYYLAPVTPLAEIVIDPSSVGRFVRSLLAPAALAVWAAELGLLVAVVAGVHVLRLARQRGEETGAASEPE